MALRDFFAELGWCDSTTDIARKPALIARIIATSLARADLQTQYPQTCSYEQRLQSILVDIRAYALDTIISSGIVVCLDQRLPRKDSGFFDSKIFAIYYNTSDRHVLSLYDNGKLQSEKGLFNDGITSRSKECIHGLAKKIRRSETLPAILLARTYSRYNSAQKQTETVFSWDATHKLASELKRNPDFFKPPLNRASGIRQVGAKPAL